MEGKVAAVIKGGYEVTVAGLRAFCPFSQMDLRRVEAPEAYVGRVLEFRISRYGEQGRNIVLTRRALLEEQAAIAAAETHEEGGRRARCSRAPSSSLADFGAFVDLGGVQGLVPGVRDLALARGPARRSPARRRGRHGQGAEGRRGQGQDLAEPEGPRGRPVGGGRRAGCASVRSSAGAWRA